METSRTSYLACNQSMFWVLVYCSFSKPPTPHLDPLKPTLLRPKTSFKPFYYRYQHWHVSATSITSKATTINQPPCYRSQFVWMLSSMVCRSSLVILCTWDSYSRESKSFMFINVYPPLRIALYYTSPNLYCGEETIKSLVLVRGEW